MKPNLPTVFIMSSVRMKNKLLRITGFVHYGVCGSPCSLLFKTRFVWCCYVTGWLWIQQRGFWSSVQANIRHVRISCTIHHLQRCTAILAVGTEAGAHCRGGEQRRISLPRYHIANFRSSSGMSTSENSSLFLFNTVLLEERNFELSLSVLQGSEWDFGVFSGIVGFEKPDPRIFEIALQKAGGVAPDQTLHIGDSLRKDYLPARSLGMHSLLIDRFQTTEHRAAREAGVPVFPDLSYAQKFISALQEKSEAAVMI